MLLRRLYLLHLLHKFVMMQLGHVLLQLGQVLLQQLDLCLLQISRISSLGLLLRRFVFLSLIHI